MKSLLDKVLELTVLLADDAERGLAEVGLTVPRAHVTWLLHHQGPLTQKALATAIGVTPRNVTGLVDGLVGAGFVTRGPHPSDRRAVLVSLTDHGAAVMRDMDRDHTALAERVFGDMREREAFSRGLDHVIARLRDALG